MNYDAANSNGSQLGPTNQKLIDRVKGDVTTLEDLSVLTKLSAADEE